MEAKPEGRRGAVTDPFEIVHKGCYLGFKFGYRISATPTGNLRVVEGGYGFAAMKSYHPLEATLVGIMASGDWLADVATTLGVSSEWIRGFLDGFAQEPEASRDGEYVQGNLTAEELHMLRYRRELPDRG
jgi:hypothetical protein